MAMALSQEGKILFEKLSLHAHGFGGWGPVSGREEGKEDKRAMRSIPKPLGKISQFKSVGLRGVTQPEEEDRGAQTPRGSCHPNLKCRDGAPKGQG